MQKREGQTAVDRPRAPAQKPDSIPYRGTANVRPTTSSTIAPASAAKPMPNQAPAPTNKAPSVPAAAPKKGSYAEILARAKAAQEAKTAIGSIKHKPVEKLAKKERPAQLAAAKGAQPAGAKSKQPLAKDNKVSGPGRSRSPEKPKAKGAEPVKEKRKPLDLGYTGTMRPKPAEPAYKGTMGLSAAARRSGYDSDRSRPVDRSRSTSSTAKAAPKGRYTYASYSDEEEEDDDGASDVSSDMEAAAWDLEEEEQMSLRVAKKEDEEALAEENRLKREKAEKKKKLEQLAASAAKKKKMY